MIQGAFPCFDASFNNGGLIEAQSTRSLLHFSLMVLKEKISQVESFLNIFVAQEMNSNNYNAQQVVAVDELTSAMAFSSMANLIQEIVQTASVMMLSCEQIALGFTTTTTLATTHENNELTSSHDSVHVEGVDKGSNQEFPILEGNSLYNWCSNMHHDDDATYNNNNNKNSSAGEDVALGVTTATATTNSTTTAINTDGGRNNEGGHEVVELDVADLLARYTHYCQVCGRGFKREANLRMHMKAHGDKYMSSTLRMSHSNTMSKKMSINNGEKSAQKRYSCPHKGCRWNKNHVKFQPLKSIVCVKNHYKRSHCPKMFVCKRCNTKEFSVLSDLKTHEKHCGEIKWYCSCGTSFSNKDKLMDHAALFVGHMPLINSNSYQFG